MPYKSKKQKKYLKAFKPKIAKIFDENGFMTNLKDASFAMSEGGSQKIAAGHFAAIKKIENEIKK